MTPRTAGLAATHAYYPPGAAGRDAGLEGGAGRWCAPVGNVALLGFGSVPRSQGRRPRKKSRPTLVVSMGGSDPLDLTRLAARALAAINMPFEARFIIGPGFRNGEALARELETLNPNFVAVSHVADLGAQFAAADLALVAFGVTAYEMAALGLPALYLALTEDHALSASSFQDAGMGEVLGLGRVLRAEDISRAVWGLLADHRRRRDMRAAGLTLIDGRAAERIAGDLAAALRMARAPKVRATSRQA